MHQLRITAGPGAGRVLALNPAYSYTLGRDAAAHLSVPEDQTLSRTHAEFVPQGGGWLLRNKSQHGSLVHGNVVHGDAPIPVGGTFQIGAITVALEAQGAEAGAPVPPPAQPAFGGDPNAPTVPPPMPGGQPQPGQPADAFAATAATPPPGGQPAGGAPQPGQPAAGQPAGGGFDAGQAGQDAKAAFAAGGAAFGAAAASLAEGAGPVKIEHEGPGYPFGDLVKGGLAIVKANLIPSLAIFAPLFLVYILIMVNAFVLQIGILALVLMLVGLAVYIATFQAILNYMAAVKEFQATGRKISIGDLMKFNDIVPRYITLFIVGVCFCLCYVPGMIVCMAVPLIVDRPEVGFMGAFKAGLAYGKKNIVPNILLCIVGGVVNMIGGIALGIGMLVTFPIVVCYFWLAYSLKKGEIEAAAAEDGIQLG